MSKRKPKKAAPAGTRTNPEAALRQALARRKKAELVDVLLELAQADRGVLRQLTARFDVAAAPDELVAATRQAIADATDFDERDINRNFDYDYEAYGEVKRNLGRLIDAGQLRLAMQLCAGADEARKLPGRNERRRNDDRRHRRLLERGPRRLSRSATCPRPKSSPGARRCSTTTAWDSSPASHFESLRNQFQAVAAP